MSSLDGYWSVDRFQVRHNLLAARLEEWRQYDLLPERSLFLVHREARHIRCDLEQDPVRLAEVQSPEVVAVHQTTVRNAERRETLDPRVVLLERGSTERDVMYASNTWINNGEIRLHGDVQLGVRASRPHLVHIKV